MESLLSKVSASVLFRAGESRLMSTERSELRMAAWCSLYCREHIIVFLTKSFILILQSDL